MAEPAHERTREPDARGGAARCRRARWPQRRPRDSRGDAPICSRCEGRCKSPFLAPPNSRDVPIHLAFQFRGESPVTSAPAWRVPEIAAARAGRHAAVRILDRFPPMPEPDDTDHSAARPVLCGQRPSPRATRMRPGRLPRPLRSIIEWKVGYPLFTGGRLRRAPFACIRDVRAPDVGSGPTARVPKFAAAGADRGTSKSVLGRLPLVPPAETAKQQLECAHVRLLALAASPAHPLPFPEVALFLTPSAHEELDAAFSVFPPMTERPSPETADVYSFHRRARSPLSPRRPRARSSRSRCRPGRIRH